MTNINQKFNQDTEFEILRHNDLIRLFRNFFQFINYTRLSDLLNESLQKEK